jgi:hypothetical protein
VAPRSFPARAVAALFVERQHLRRPRQLTLGGARLERFAADVGGIQLDSINVVDRAHYLTVWSRFGVYDRAALDRLIYRRRVLYEYWAHAACLIAAEHLPMWRRAMLDYSARKIGWRFLKKNAAVMAEVEGAIRERGPLANADFEHKRRGGSSGWWNWKPAMHALHHLWLTGRLLVHSRVHFQKRYDLAERIVPNLERLEVPSADEFRRWHIRQALHAMGAATDVDLRMYLTFPRASVMARRATLAALLASGEVVEVAVDGSPARWLALAEDLPALATASRRRRIADGTTLLSPFDSFLWHRERVKRLFGFDYRIEVYTPGHKRTHGYYSLPIFHDGMLIGRVDAKAHRAERRLEMRHVHFERWVASGGAPAGAWHRDGIEIEPALSGLAGALASLAAFTGAERMLLDRVTPTKLRAPLARALRDAEIPAGAPANPVTAEAAD